MGARGLTGYRRRHAELFAVVSAGGAGAWGLQVARGGGDPRGADEQRGGEREHGDADGLGQRDEQRLGGRDGERDGDERGSGGLGCTLSGP